MRALLEEQRLRYDRLYRVGLIGLGAEKGRLGPLAGQEPVGVGGDEDHRHLDRSQHFVDGVESGAPIGKLDIGQDKTRLLLLHRVHRLAMRAGDARHAMA